MELFVAPEGDMWEKMPRVMSLEFTRAQNYKFEKFGSVEWRTICAYQTSIESFSSLLKGSSSRLH